MTKGHWSDALVCLHACPEAVKWARTQPSAKVAWATCHRGDWMLWLLGRLDTSAPWSEERKPLVRVALACAAGALERTPEGEARELAEQCLGVTQAWCEGAATQGDVMEVRADAYAAAASNTAAAAHATAYAAATATAGAAATATAYAASAAGAAANAAIASAAATARARSLAESADIVRSHYPSAPKLVQIDALRPGKDGAK